MKPAIAFPMALAGLLSAACATNAAPGAHASNAPASLSEPSPASPFETLADGSLWHPASQGRCPADLSGFTFTQTVLFNPDGSNVGCQYEGVGGTSFLTVYFYPQASQFENELMAAQLGTEAIRYHFPEADYMKDESRDCAISIDRMKAADAGEPRHGVTLCLIYRIDYGAALLATDMVGPWHLKVRITAPLPSEGAEPLARRAADIMRLQYGWMNGLPADFAEAAP